MRVAIIGSGISGLAAATTLVKEGHDVVVFERDNRVGGHAHTQRIAGVDVDTGFMVFNRVTYPNLLNWFAEHGVEVEASDMSFAVSVNDGYLEWASNGLSSFFAQWTNVFNVNMYRMVVDMVSFQRQVLEFLATPESAINGEAGITLGAWLSARGYSSYFIDYYILPVCGATWSAPGADVLNFPARPLFTFMRNHHLLQLFGRPEWETVTGRSQVYVEKVTAPLRGHIRTGTEVTGVRTKDDGSVEVAFRSAGGEDVEVFHAAVIAAHAPDALRMLGAEATAKETALLSAFPYMMNDIYLHSDTSLMPQNRSAWASWNFLGDSENGTSVSYWLNKLQNLETEEQVFVTLNPKTPPKAATIAARWQTDHPVPTVESARAQTKMQKIQGVRNVYFAGAYLGYGFHEDGFKAGLEAAHGILGRPFHALENPPQFAVSTVQSFARAAVCSFLRDFITEGRLVFLETGGSVVKFGRDAAAAPVNVFVHSPQFYTAVAWRSDLGLADAYIKGWWTGDLRSVFEVLIASRDKKLEKDGAVGGVATSRLGSGLAYLQHIFRANTIANAEKNIHAHYDLGNDFFSLFLDPTMAYSCAVFETPQDSLEAAQHNKMRKLMEKADLRPEHHVLEIGFGWGALAIKMATEVGCRVTGITLSREQKAEAEARIAKLGLSHLIDFVFADYRTLPVNAAYDRILSCEMLEAVGHEFLPEFYEHTARLLKPQGRLVVQVITCPDQRYDEYRTSTDFIKEYIFPGGCTPSMRALDEANNGRLELSLVDNFAQHYATTLDRWCEVFEERKEKVMSLGFSEEFFRTWIYYFVYCSAGFATDTLGLMQLAYVKA